MPRCCGGSASPRKSRPLRYSSRPIRRPTSPVKPLAYPAAWEWAAEMEQDTALAPIDRAIARIRAVYQGWNRDTTVARRRRAWDPAFGGRTPPVTCEGVAVGGIHGEWRSPADAAQHRAIL